MAQDETGNKSAPRRWMRVALVVSLALNLLVAGVVVGALFSAGWRHMGHMPHISGAAGPMTHALAEPDRKAIAQQMRQAYREGRPGRAAQSAAFESLIEDLRAERFDRSAIEAHLAGIRSMISERVELGQGLLLDRLSAMDPAARRAYADRLEAGWHHHARRARSD
ncbi:MAG: periplasmic heavy metal sensor [Pseudomonadota bacterium]|uniref:periplasmic heavy metal sensor n=1 Tax=Roseovarius TaxID=74030 RepID=UPI0022A74DC1|nr:periplasmic heavy metal sensor [Roseovarius sp. EGI FJ00037]MCZ0811774.1 periplasmic heavy metal sensor [Roseovarius sp. EGI FJ00037]